MSEALTLFDAGLWQRRHKSDPAALALADRHYSRRRPGSNQIGSAARRLVFVTPCERALWLTSWPNPDRAMDGLDAWRCMIFRNEGAGLSSELIRAAMTLTAELWEGPPADGWLTYIEPAKIRSAHPGYCFKAAGWELDRGYRRSNGQAIIRLRA
jgi:hypothetical protein